MIHALSEALAVRDFPSALVRFLLCLGVIPNVIPPHRPDLNAYVERFHRLLGQECLQIHRPGTLSQVSELTETFLVHYNSERPNQARSCGNQPPRVACQQFPMLPRVPETVDPDRWLVQMHKHAFARTIRVGGDLTINHQDYYVSQSLSGQRVTCWLNAAEKRYGSKTFPVFMLARDGRVIADDARKVRFSMRDVAIEPDTGKPVANQVIYEYTDGAERYVLTFTREKDTLHYKFIEELHGIKALLARLIRIDGAYLRFTGELSFEHYQADMLVETHCDESLWELMYFGHVPRE